MISAVTPGRDGTTIIRVYEAAGQAAGNIAMTVASPITAAAEVNLMEDHLSDVKAEGRTIEFDLKPFQIRTFAIKLNAHIRQWRIERFTIHKPTHTSYTSIGFRLRRF